MAVGQALGYLFGEGLVALTIQCDLIVQLGVARVGVAHVRLDLVELVLEVVDGDPVEERRTQREPDAESEEHGGDRDDVVAEVDHPVRVSQ